MKDITIKDVTNEELQFLYKRTVKEKPRRKTNKIRSEIIKGMILLISIIVISVSFLKILR